MKLHGGFSSAGTLLVVVLLCTLAASLNPALDREWERFKLNHGKSYSSEKHELLRRSIFEQNFAKIVKHNAEAAKGLHTYTLGVNQLADLSSEEYKTLLGARVPKDHTSDRSHRGKLFRPPKGFVAPSSVDWRKKGYVTPVKDQGMCGSCWAFSSTGSLEGAHFKATGNLTSLSEQNLVDCSSKNNGCNGGWMDLAFQYIISNNGIDTETSYPYSSVPDSCFFNEFTIGATMRMFVDVPKDENSLQMALAVNGPVSVAIDASQDSFHLYQSGIYNETNCLQDEPDHAVLVVGYGSENGKDFWIVKNSWNTTWGELGYIRMARNNNNMCGIATHASYPVV